MFKKLLIKLKRRFTRNVGKYVSRNHKKYPSFYSFNYYNIPLKTPIAMVIANKARNSRPHSMCSLEFYSSRQYHYSDKGRLIYLYKQHEKDF